MAELKWGPWADGVGLVRLLRANRVYGCTQSPAQPSSVLSGLWTEWMTSLFPSETAESEQAVVVVFVP